MTHVKPSHYLGVFAILMALTGLTVWAAYQNFGVWGTPIALGIAGIKAALVIIIFMHVRWSERLVAVFAASGFLWLGILFLLVYGDVVTR